MNPSKLLRYTAFTCGAILIVAVGYKQYQARQVVPEVVEKADFQPAPTTLAERAKFQLAAEGGQNVLSTTLPVSTSMKIIPFAQSSQALEVSSPQAGESDADNSVGTTPVKGAYLIKFSNSQLCEKEACPVALMTQSDDASLIQATLLQFNAKNIWVSNRTHNGNPDLIVDYGTGAPPSRLVWSTEGQYPAYMPVPGPVPELK